MKGMISMATGSETNRTEHLKALALKYIDANNRADAAEIADMMADDGILTLMGTTPISGSYTKQQVKEAAAGVFAPFPDGLRFTLVDIVAEGDTVVLEVASSGRHKSGLMYENKYIYKFRYRGEEVIEFKEFCDTELVSKVLCGTTTDD
jgi:ketosteroid isomerase-like protein